MNRKVLLVILLSIPWCLAESTCQNGAWKRPHDASLLQKTKHTGRFALQEFSTTDDDENITYILHLVESCDFSSSSVCSGKVTFYSDTEQTSKIAAAGLGETVECANSDDYGMMRRRRRRRGGSNRRRDCTTESFVVDEGCQLTHEEDGEVTSFYPPGTYLDCPCESKSPDLVVGNYSSLCDASAEYSNLALRYEVGVNVTAWGTDCVENYAVMVMKDNVTGLYYVLENASNPCPSTPADEINPSTQLTSSDKGTCSGLGSFGQCVDVATAGTAGFSAMLETIDMESESSIAVILELAIPILSYTLTQSWAGEALLDTNFCLGTWLGSELAGAASSSSLYADNCNYPPYVDTNTYNVMAFSIPAAALNSFGLCGESDVQDAATMCVAYTSCSSGQPTFAMQLDGTSAGCFFSNGPVSVTSGGLSTLVGNAVSLGVDTIGWGVSLTGEFQKTFSIFDGSVRDATINGHTYMVVGVDLGNLLPASVDDLLQMSGTVYIVAQIGDGSLTQTVRDLYSTSNPVQMLAMVSQMSVYASFSVSLYVKFSDLTDNLLSDMYLGDAITINGLTTTQTIGDLLPGMYLYSETGIDAMAAVMSWATSSFAGIIDAIGGTNFASEFESLVSGADYGSSKFGLFLNTDSFGFMIEVPATAAIFAAFPLGGSMDLGTLEIECTVKLVSVGITCGIGYDSPRWLGALWKNAKMVLGAVSDTASAAFDSAVDAVGGLVADIQWGKVADKAGTVASKAAGPILESKYFNYASNAVVTAVNSGVVKSSVKAVTSTASKVTNIAGRRRRRRRRIM